MGQVDTSPRLTKEMLLDPSRRIELDDLIKQETRHVLHAMTSDERFAVGTLPSGDDEVTLAIVEQTLAYRDLVEPLCRSLQVAAR